MIDSPTLNAQLHDLPTAADYANAARRRRWGFAVGGLLLALLVVATFTSLETDNPVLPLALLICLATPILLWHFPRLSLYMVFAGVCLFELYQTPFTDALTDRVPFFWNVNTIFETYAHFNPKAVPLNLMEVLILTAGVCSSVYAVYTKRVGLRSGRLLFPILAYIAFVGWGWFNGMATGGDSKIALQEVRSQIYFLLAYLMAVNIVHDRRNVNTLLWILVSCIGLKGILYTFRRYVTIAGMPLPDQGVGSHEEAFLFDCFEVLLVIFLLCGVHKKMQILMWVLLPFVVTGNLACNRRAATAAFVVVVPMLILAAYRALPNRRRLVGSVGIFLAIVFPIYYQAFKNSESLYAQPARAIKSNFQPDERDALSNAYRDAEKADIMATVKSAPVQGYGYGKRMFHAVPIADISQQYEWWDIMPHNQILWVWMRVGTVGFWTFWMMISAIVIYLCRLLQRVDFDAENKAVALFALLVIGMLLMFGLLDLQLSNFRDMLFAGFWVGCAVAAGLFPASATAPRRESGTASARAGFARQQAAAGRA